jgi:hypothetical protein
MTFFLAKELNNVLGEPLRTKKAACWAAFFVARVGLCAVRFAHTCAAASRLLGTARKRAAATIPLAGKHLFGLFKSNLQV